MKLPDYEDFWLWEPEDDGWLYSGYWDLCMLLYSGSAGFWL